MMEKVVGSVIDRTRKYEIIVYAALWLLVIMMPFFNEIMRVVNGRDFSWYNIYRWWLGLVPFILIFCVKIHDDNNCTLGATMKYLSLLVWVTQFGFSVLFPVCFFLMVAFWLQQKFALGIWIVAVLGVLGLLTSFSTAKSCLRSLLKEMDRASDRKDPPPAFNDHA